MTKSRIPGFYSWSLQKRRQTLAELTGHTGAFDALNPGALSLELADKLIENVIGVLGLPVGLGLNLQVNGEDYLVPMAVEEPSVVAAFSNAAKMARAGGGFEAEADPPRMIGQIQLICHSDPHGDEVVKSLEAGVQELKSVFKEAAQPMEKRGGGYREHKIRRLEDPEGGPPMVVVHVVVDVADAMGANLINHVVESAASTVERLSGLKPHLRILSNLADLRLARAKTRIPVAAVGGEAVALGIAEADRFARMDPYRAATHNKGLLNGIDAVALATGNDWRAIEAGAHAWACKGGRYKGLTRWVVEDGHLCGSLELPMQVGTVGGITRSHPTIALLRNVLGVTSARQLAGVFAAVGLAQNLAAIRALATEGIQRGHMSLHARQLAIAAGAQADEVDGVVAQVIAKGLVSADGVARQLAEQRAARE